MTFPNVDGTSRQALIRLLTVEDAVELQREPENPFDPNAIAVEWRSLDKASGRLGYIPRGLAAALSPCLDSGTSCQAKILRRRRIPRQGVASVPIWAVRIQITLLTTHLPDGIRNGLEPALSSALAADSEELAAGDAPCLGLIRPASASVIATDER
ncbi:MAG: HIRAN domain-containing protein [Candidatus Sericytochromatia bacterium]|nr:HIRAN domain-containing protein [Candidatus Sericytochromatia bacterium]